MTMLQKAGVGYGIAVAVFVGLAIAASPRSSAQDLFLTVALLMIFVPCFVISLAAACQAAWRNNWGGFLGWAFGAGFSCMVCWTALATPTRADFQGTADTNFRAVDILVNGAYSTTAGIRNAIKLYEAARERGAADFLHGISDDPKAQTTWAVAYSSFSTVANAIALICQQDARTVSLILIDAVMADTADDPLVPFAFRTVTQLMLS